MFVEPFPSVRNFYERCSDPVHLSCGAQLNVLKFKSLTRHPPRKDGPTSRTPNRIPVYAWRTSLQVRIDNSTSKYLHRGERLFSKSATTTARHRLPYVRTGNIWDVIHLLNYDANKVSARSCRNPPI